LEEAVILTTNEILEEIRQAEIETGVEGGFSVEELRESLGWGIIKTRRILRRLIADGKVENVQIVRRTMAGYSRPTIGYKFVGGAA
jgi:hypothetical protein